MLPPPDVFSRNVSALGIGDQMDIVIYEQEGVFSAPRAWWTFRTSARETCTFSTAAFVHGAKPGFLRRAEIPPRPRCLQRQTRSNAVKDFAQIEQMIAAHGQILDARFPPGNLVAPCRAPGPA